MKIALDIDGVLCETRGHHKTALEQEFGVTLQDGSEYGAFGFHHPSEDVMTLLRLRALEIWQRPTVFANGECTPGAAHQARLFHARGLLAGYVTRRYPRLEWDTRDWLLRHDFPLQDPCRLHHMAGDVDSKAEHIHRFGASVIIEDSPKEALQILEDGRVDVVLLDKPYNREIHASMLHTSGAKLVRAVGIGQAFDLALFLLRGRQQNLVRP